MPKVDEMPEFTRDDALNAIGSQIAWWLRYDAEERKREGLEIHADNHIIPPCWPSRSQLIEWLKVLSPGATNVR